MIEFEIQKFLKNKAKELNLNDSFGLNFLRSQKQKKAFKETKILSEIEKSLRSKLLKIFEDLMGKKPMIEVIIHLAR
jgi:mRNA degradation ribonuclease J1/J2